MVTTSRIVDSDHSLNVEVYADTVNPAGLCGRGNPRTDDEEDLGGLELKGWHRALPQRRHDHQVRRPADRPLGLSIGTHHGSGNGGARLCAHQLVAVLCRACPVFAKNNKSDVVRYQQGRNPERWYPIGWAHIRRCSIDGSQGYRGDEIKRALHICSGAAAGVEHPEPVDVIGEYPQDGVGIEDVVALSVITHLNPPVVSHAVPELSGVFRSPSFIARSPGSRAHFGRGWKRDGAPGQLRLTLKQVLEIGERPVGIRWLVFPARRQLRRRVSDLLPRVLIIVTVET
jgi:hypothetical protein